MAATRECGDHTSVATLRHFSTRDRESERERERERVRERERELDVAVSHNLEPQKTI